MDPTYNLRNFFFKTASAFNKFHIKDDLRIKKKLNLVEEIEDDLFFLKESAKKMFKSKKLKERNYDLLMKRVTMITLELKKIKKKIINP